jgi:putative oxidoreductase
MPERTTHPNDLFLLLLRAGAGLMLFGFHGLGKLQAAFGLLQGREWTFVAFVEKFGFPFPVFFAVCAALAEGVGSLLLAAGLFTRYAAAAVGFTMLIAVAHHVRTDMRFELAAVYLLIALLFVFSPPGRFSLDARRK